ncbi:MAG: large conductance mechanosensitive channel protein MscL [Burkholderiaceae bacterium]
MSVLKEFRDFAMKGNVIDLAVAVIVGAAFSKIVDSLVKDLVNPILGAIIGKPDFTNLFWVIKLPEGYAGAMTYDALTKAGATVLGYGAFLTAVINFVLLAFVIFWMVKMVSGVKSKLDAAAPPPDDVLLLREIRDLLQKQNSK